MTTAPPPAWARAGDDWPNRAHSRFVRTGGITWHVQIMGAGPLAFLVHGTGAATHSWRDLAPRLARHFTVVAPDLPGHGFTEIPTTHRLSLPGMARDLATLCKALEISPALAVGHSAGAPILARMCLDGAIAPAGLVSLNGAFLPLAGSAGQIFAPLARFLVGFPLLPKLFAWRAGDRRVVEQLLAGTGSRLDQTGVDFYARVVRNPGHAAAALRMMAGWDLVPVVRDLPQLRPPLLLLAGDRDRAIPPADAPRVQALVPGSAVHIQKGLGHLAHEEDPAGTAALILEFARKVGAL
jgi:magnesium chelatase accessory protein